jgi:succinate dehydrogenase/fumarate reductase flavoprotein subunit
MDLSNRYQKLADYDVEHYRGLTLEAKEKLDAVDRELIQCEELHNSLTIKITQEKKIHKALQKSVDLLNNIVNTRNSLERTKKTNESVEKELANVEIDTKKLDSEALVKYSSIIIGESID